MRPPFGTSVPGNRFDLLDGRTPDAAPRVSVIVAHYRQQRELDRTLAALARQDHPRDRLDVIVVDDGSPSLPVVPDGVTLLTQEDRGFRLSAARNLGVRAASGDVLCFLDADTAPEPAYIRRMARLPALAPETIAVGTRRHADLGRTDADTPVESAGPANALPAPTWLDDAYRDSADLLRADDRSYRYVIGAVTACSRWFFDEIGGFDESFTEYGGEDWEWAQRAWLAGSILAHVPDAVAWHDGADWAGRDDSAQAIKNRETLRLAGVIPVAGSRPLAVRTRGVDVQVTLADTDASDAAVFLCVDSVLAALPEARVLVPDRVAALFAADARVAASGVHPDTADPTPGARSRDAARARTDDARVLIDRARVQVDLARPVRVRDAASLRDAVASVGVGTLGVVRLGPLVTVGSRRAALRAARWGRDDLFDTVERPSDGIEPIDGEPSLAAYLGGWG